MARHVGHFLALVVRVVHHPRIGIGIRTDQAQRVGNIACDIQLHTLRAHAPGSAGHGFAIHQFADHHVAFGDIEQGQGPGDTVRQLNLAAHFPGLALFRR
ncbi:hypothetical protein D3C80_1145200 [compost metagenome]